ncbi:MAG: hypothetical protein Q7K43_02110 [Candidatus Woesearchaeota archaeon]|nr:hypothetical protein [Candidatus Woesearchaeota archaeon]
MSENQSVLTIIAIVLSILAIMFSVSAWQKANDYSSQGHMMRGMMSNNGMMSSGNMMSGMMNGNSLWNDGHSHMMKSKSLKNDSEKESRSCMMDDY